MDYIPSTPLDPAVQTKPFPNTPSYPDYNPSCGGHHGRRHKPTWCGPVDTTKPGHFYDVHHNPCPPEGYNMKPLEPYVPGLSTERQMEYLYHNMNHLIDIFNQANEKVFGAYQAVVGAATCNNAYYNEVKTDIGYIDSRQTSYKVTIIPFVDCAGEPIYFELGLPNDNTSNDVNPENCYSASKRKLADKLIPATQVDEQWKGYVYHRGRQINSPQPAVLEPTDKSYYTFGVTRNGFFKWYPADVIPRVLAAEQIVDAMNVSAVLINSGKISEELFSENKDQVMCRVGVGMNYKDKTRYIIVVDGSEQIGCTELELAKLFEKYGCDIAVQTAYSFSAFGMDKGTLEFIPPTVYTDDTPTMPETNGFWYITKKRNYHNEFVEEIAELTQKMGEQLWYCWLKEANTDYLKDRIHEVYNQLKEETGNRIEGDDALSDRIDAIRDMISERIDHVERVPLSVTKDAWYIVMTSGNKIEVPVITYNYDTLVQKLITYDNFEGALNSEISARQEADNTLRELITAVNEDLAQETADRIQGDNDLRALFTDPDSTVMQEIRRVESTLTEKINFETTGRTNADNEIKAVIDEKEANLNTRLDSEITNRTAADGAIRLLIEAEEAARIAGDQALSDKLKVLRDEYEAFVNGTNQDIQDLQDAMEAVRLIVDVQIEEILRRLGVAEGDIQNLNNQYNELINRIAALNSAITALQSAFNTLETSYDNFKTAFSDHLESFHNLQERVNTNEISISTINQQISNIIADIGGGGSVEDNFKDKIENGPWLDRVNVGGSEGLSTTMRPDANGIFFSRSDGDTGDKLAEVKTADPTTDTSAVPRSYMDDQIAQAIADGHNYTDQQIEELDITNKLTGVLHLAGGTMEGQIKQPLDPADAEDLVNKKYIDDNFARTDYDGFLPTAGGTMQGDLHMRKIPEAETSTSIFFDNDNEKSILMYGYTSDDKSTLFVKNDLSEPVIIRNVADPVDGTDAMNFNTFNEYVRKGVVEPSYGKYKQLKFITNEEITDTNTIYNFLFENYALVIVNASCDSDYQKLSVSLFEGEDFIGDIEVEGIQDSCLTFIAKTGVEYALHYRRYLKGDNTGTLQIRVTYCDFLPSSINIVNPSQYLPFDKAGAITDIDMKGYSLYNTRVFLFEIPVSVWEADSYGVWHASVIVTGMLASTNPVIGFNQRGLLPNLTKTQIDEIYYDYCKLTTCETLDDKVTFTSYTEAPTHNIPILLRL